MTKRFLFSLFIVSMMAGCYPGGADYTDELDLVLTGYDKTYGFSAAKTYAIPDKIPMITGNLADGELPNYLDAASATVILGQIESNLKARGYTKAITNADIVVMVAVLEITTVEVYCNDWWGYWGWWGYYPGYPGYGGCYYPSAYSYTTGSVLISMVDDKSEDGDASTPVRGVWSAGINGLVSGSDASIQERVEKGIDQAFTQSPYIKTN